MHSEAAKPDLLRCYESYGVSELVDKRDPLRVRQAVSFCCAEQPLAIKPLN